MAEPVGSDAALLADPSARIRAKAFALGFSTVGIARADEPLGVEFDRYESFLAAGFAGTMGYLEDNREARRRLDTGDILAGARSVICVARRYGRPQAALATDPPWTQGIARYARGQDYHVFLRKRLRRLAAFVRGLGPGVEARAFCDVEPVLERAWAARAGIGFIGKNGMIITPGHGSYQLLGEVITTLALTPNTPMFERCGTCTRCLDACPTKAFRAPFVLDARRCIAYLTIEDQATAPEPLRSQMGEHLFGCDVCQEACPFNSVPPPAESTTAQFQPLARWRSLGISALTEVEPEGWDGFAGGSPLYRAGRRGLARNAVIVAANRVAHQHGDESDEKTLEAAGAHDDPDVRALAAWARRRVRHGPSG